MMGTSPSEEILGNGNHGETDTLMIRPLPLPGGSSLVFHPIDNNNENEQGDDEEETIPNGHNEEDDDDEASYAYTSPPNSNPPSETEEESEEEDLDFLDEDEEEDAPESEALIDHLHITFRNVLEEKIRETERFFDRGFLVPCKTVDAVVQTEEYSLTNSKSSVVETRSTLVGDTVSSASAQIEAQATKSLMHVPVPPPVVEAKAVETQTDDTSASAFLTDVSREGIDAARNEVGKLRKAREPLHFEMARLAAQYKGTGRTKSEEDERTMYELEEAIEAIDTAIEFKNELICGQEVLLMNSLAPGQERADLVTRLASLSVFDLQRLFCKSFAKVVELRFCTKQLEKDVDKLKDEKKRMRRKIHMDTQASKDKDKEHETRIAYLLKQCNQNPNNALQSHIMFLEHELSKTKRKLHDFQLSLTELLIRHGYLINGHDYEVNQVIHMLGLDLEDVRNPRDRDRSKHTADRSNAAPQHQLNSARAPQPPISSSRRNRHSRRNAEVGFHTDMAISPLDGGSPFGNHHHHSRRHGHGYLEQAAGHAATTHAHSSRHHHSSTSRPFSERESRRSKPEYGQNLQTQSGTDVQKLKNKIILHQKNPH